MPESGPKPSNPKDEKTALRNHGVPDRTSPDDSVDESGEADEPSPFDLAKEVDRVAGLPSSTNELDDLLSRTPEELKRVLKEEFRAEFLGPVVVNPDQLD